MPGAGCRVLGARLISRHLEVVAEIKKKIEKMKTIKRLMNENYHKV
jgi:hypothetical protein